MLKCDSHLCSSYKTGFALTLRYINATKNIIHNLNSVFQGRLGKPQCQPAKQPINASKQAVASNQKKQ